MTAGAVRLGWVSHVAVLHLDNPPVNAATAALRRSLLDTLRAVLTDSAVRGIVLVGSGATFIAGSDLAEFAGPIARPTLPTVVAALAASRVPVVAALDGHALGGGLEVALGCHARVATPSARLGLPEVSLGMVPGAGGTQRLPRLIGVPAATDLVCTSRRIEAAEAADLGLVDAVVERDELVTRAVELTTRVGRRPVSRPRPYHRVVIPSGRPNVRAAARLVRLATQVDLATGLRIERAAFHRYRRSPDAAALRHLFFAERAAARPAPDTSTTGGRPAPDTSAAGGRSVTPDASATGGGWTATRGPTVAGRSADPVLVGWREGGRDLVEVCSRPAAEPNDPRRTDPWLDNPTTTDPAATVDESIVDTRVTVDAALAAARRAGQLAVVSRPRPGDASAGAVLRHAALTAIADQRAALGDAAVAASLRRFGYTWRPLPAAAVSGTDAAAGYVSRAVAAAAARLVADGVLASAGDADVLAVAAVGFPRFRGGPLWWVER